MAWLNPALAFARSLGVRGWVIIALAVLLTGAIVRGNIAQGQRDRAMASYALSEANHAITRASLVTLQGELAKMVTDGELRSERLTDALQEVRHDTDHLRRQAELIRMEGGGGDPCLTPAPVMGAGL